MVPRANATPTVELGELGEHHRLPRLGDHRRDKRRAVGFEVVDERVQDPGPLGRAASTPRPVVEAPPRFARSRARTRRAGVTDTSVTSDSSAGFSTAKRLIALDPTAGDVGRRSAISAPTRASPSDVRSRGRFYSITKRAMLVNGSDGVGAVDDRAAEVRRGVAGDADGRRSRWRSPARPESWR